jgi:uncharacterized protein
VKGKVICIDAGGYSVTGWLYGAENRTERKEPRPAALFLRGWSPGLPRTFMEAHASICARKLGMICMAAEFRGMGSPGDANKLTRADFLDDALAAFRALSKTEGVDTRNIFVVGESLGAYLACILSARQAVRGLVLRVPADFPNEGFAHEADLSQVIHRTMGWRSRAHNPGDSMALDAISRFQGDVFIVASQRDSLIPMETIENYRAATRNQAAYVCMKNAGHALISPFKHRQFQEMLVEWLCQRIVCSDGKNGS